MKHLKPRIKTYLLQGKKVTVLQALKMWGTTELRVYVSRLIKDGYNVQSEEVKKGKKRFNRYFIPI